MLKKFGTLLLLVLVFSGAGCNPESGHPSTERRPGAPQAKQPPQPAPGAQQPAPAGDPGEHNKQPGEVDLHVDWTSENAHEPACEWSKNGAVNSCSSMSRAHKEGKLYYGLWEHGETGQAGDVFSLNAHGWPGTNSIECSIFWKGSYHQLPSRGSQCGGTFTLN